MGRGERELLAAAAENDYTTMIVSACCGLVLTVLQDLLSQRAKPTITDSLKASFLGKKKAQDPVI